MTYKTKAQKPNHQLFLRIHTDLRDALRGAAELAGCSVASLANRALRAIAALPPVPPDKVDEALQRRFDGE